ncbi:hypothetical protein QLQ12_26325 [Actinoplanes sp. NEAU-A12]|uniref:Adhesin domain-containing protein n=1 Tax=Actinoplanes sandaracinus TaxID=3045177 RepID=A0ABT6WR78_9ACTN|nr:hypothetical protein [Actinoplanes sandaracinus]MDI6102140.1 hypothetical protein [Actinoplanes sandaracinus]
MGRLEPPADERGLRIGGYVDRARHRAPEPDPAPRPPGVSLPNISDYWPDAPHQRRTRWEGFQPVPPGGRAPRMGDDDRPGSADRRWLQRPVVLTGVVALTVVFGTVLLARPLADSEIRQQRAALPPSAIPLEPQFAVPPQPPPLLLSPTPSLSPSAPAVRAARLDFVTGVTELTVRTADLGGQEFLVTAPDGTPVEAGATFVDGVLRIDVTKSGGTVEVSLNDRITWHLRLAAGVKLATFDTTTGTVSRIDLDGGAERIDVILGRLAGVVPIRMTGGVGTWVIRTDGRVPARVTVGDGAGNIAVYDDRRGGTGGGAVIESGTLGAGPGLDVDAAAGMGSLEITRR